MLNNAIILSNLYHLNSDMNRLVALVEVQTDSKPYILDALYPSYGR